MNEGKSFEQQFKSSIPLDYYYLRLNDPAQSFTQDSSSLRFSPQNPYDAVLFSPNGYLFCLELKSTLGSLTYWKEEFENKKSKSTFNIKKNQILGLEKASKHKRIIAGFVLNFRKVNQTYFLSIKQFNDLIKDLGKKSINENDVIGAGAYLIEQKLKKIKYSYNIEKFVVQMRELYN